jgi:hypothetical protein
MCPMRKLKIDLGDLAFAFESGFHELSNYLDLETGEIVVVTDDTRRELEEIYEEMEAGEREDASALARHLDGLNLPAWQKQMMLQADQVERDYGTRFVAVPHVDSHEAYGDMEDFIATVRNPHLRELLEVAIMGRGAFRRFKDVLLNYPREEKRWFAFQEARMFERVREWLEEYDVEPTDDMGGGDE